MGLEKSDAVRRAKTDVGKRAMFDRSVKILENPKNLLVSKGNATSEVIDNVLVDMFLLKKPVMKKLNRNNDVLPFESGGESHLKNLFRLNDASLFTLSSCTRKRPHNLVIGRTSGFRILDMIYLGVGEYWSMTNFEKAVPSALGSSPLILFNGDNNHLN